MNVDNFAFLTEILASPVEVRKLQNKVMYAWRQISIDEPVVRRIEAFMLEPPYWNHHVALAAICSRFDVRSYLEIGSRIGASTSIVLTNVYRGFVMTAVDLWEPYTKGLVPETLENFKEQMSVFHTDIECIQGNSHTVLKELIKQSAYYDLILVDGDHSKRGATEDLEDAYELCSDGALIVFDDINNKGCPYLSEVAKEFQTKHNCASLWNDKDDNGTVIFQIKK